MCIKQATRPSQPCYEKIKIWSCDNQVRLVCSATEAKYVLEIMDITKFYDIMYVLLGIPVMRYDRAARPCALNFRIAALKCRFGRPPNALSSVGCMTFYAPTLCLFYPKRNNTNRTPIYRKKNVAYPNTVTCLLSQIVPVNKQIKSNQQLMTLLIVYILDDTCEITCTRSRCSRHYLRSNNYRKNVLRWPKAKHMPIFSELIIQLLRLK